MVSLRRNGEVKVMRHKVDTASGTAFDILGIRSASRATSSKEKTLKIYLIGEGEAEY